MGTKKGQRRKTARRAYEPSKKKTGRSVEPPMSVFLSRSFMGGGRSDYTGISYSDQRRGTARYRAYVGRKERQRKKAGGGAFEQGAWVPFDFPTWWRGWGKRASRGKK